MVLNNLRRTITNKNAIYIDRSNNQETLPTYDILKELTSNVLLLKNENEGVDSSHNSVWIDVGNDTRPVNLDDNYLYGDSITFVLAYTWSMDINTDNSNYLFKQLLNIKNPTNRDYTISEIGLVLVYDGHSYLMTREVLKEPIDLLSGTEKTILVEIKHDLS